MLDLLRVDLLRPAVVEPAIRMAIDMLAEDGSNADAHRRDVERQIDGLDRKVAALTAAVEAGGHLPALLTALEAREAERAALRSKLAEHATGAPTSLKDRRTLERRLREKLTDWRVLLAAETNHARQILEELLLSRLVFTPTTDAGQRCYRMTGTFALGRICSQLLRSHGMASPSGTETQWTLRRRGQVRAA